VQAKFPRFLNVLDNLIEIELTDHVMSHALRNCQYALTTYRRNNLHWSINKHGTRCDASSDGAGQKANSESRNKAHTEETPESFTNVKPAMWLMANNAAAPVVFIILECQMMLGLSTGDLRKATDYTARGCWQPRRSDLQTARDEN